MSNELNIRIAKLEAQCRRLLEENEALRSQLGMVSNISTYQPSPVSSTTLEQFPASTHSPTELSTDAKIQLFRSLFKGREDVYSVRWDSKNGRSGYAPACDNEWLSGVCDKPRIKCADCNNRKLLSINNQAIYHHLSGKKIIGGYSGPS